MSGNGVSVLTVSEQWCGLPWKGLVPSLLLHFYKSLRVLTQNWIREQILLKINYFLLTRFQLNSLTMAAQMLVLAQGKGWEQAARVRVGLWLLLAACHWSEVKHHS